MNDHPTGTARQRLAEAVEHLFTGYFALVMATGIVSIAAHVLQMPRIAWALLAVNIGAHAVLTVMLVTLWPRQTPPIDQVAGWRRLGQTCQRSLCAHALVGGRSTYASPEGQPLGVSSSRGPPHLTGARTWQADADC